MMVTLRNVIPVSPRLHSVTLALVGAICSRILDPAIDVLARHGPHTSYNV